MTSPIVDPMVLELLSFWADSLDEMERLRIATDNRYTTLTNDDEHGHGLPKEHPGVIQMAALVGNVSDIEKQLTKSLEATMKDHPLGEWVSKTKGLGLKTSARYIASVGGDPAWHNKEERVRTLGELWSYSGLGVVNGKAPSRRRGQQASWNDKARMRIWNMSLPMIRNKKSTYRHVYDFARLKYEDSTHSDECVRCGPSGKPALEGSDLSLGHKHARATRIVMKELTRDMWSICEDIHRP